MQQARSGNKGVIIALLALLLLLVVGGGLFFLLQNSPQPGPISGPIAVQVTATTNAAQATATPGTAQVGPVKAEAGDTVVTLTWQSVGDATGYFVRRDGERGPLNVKPISETRYIDIGLTNGRVYTYTVTPVIGGVEGSSLPPVQVAPVPPR